MSDPKHKRTRFLSPEKERERENERKKEKHKKTSRTLAVHGNLWGGKGNQNPDEKRERASGTLCACSRQLSHFRLWGWPVCYGVILAFFLFFLLFQGGKKSRDYSLDRFPIHRLPSSYSSSSSTLLYKLRKESRTAPPLLVGFFFSIPTHTQHNSEGSFHSSFCLLHPPPLHQPPSSILSF